MSSLTFDYDRPSDTLYIKLRPGESVDNEIFCDGDIVIDIGADGAPLGYEIQHASAQRDFIAAIILGDQPLTPALSPPARRGSGSRERTQ
jgi:uncharacterized protein YuzE